MKKLYVVKKKQDFDSIIKAGVFRKNESFIIYCRNNNLKFDRFGISVGKKIGNAVERTYYKRRIRTIIDSYRKIYNNNKDNIIILRRGALIKSYNEIEKDFNKIMSKKGF